MTGSLVRHRRKGVWVIGGLLIAAGMGTLGTAAAQPVDVDGDEALALFAEMMPVFQSPRCANCRIEARESQTMKEER